MNAKLARWIILGAAMATVALTTSLGMWQMRRAQIKLDRQSDLSSQALMPVLTNESLDCRQLSASAQENRRVQLRGRWLSDATWILDNRAMSGKAGFFVVTGFELEAAGPCSKKVVLIQRGWLPRNIQHRADIPRYETPHGPVSIAGRLMLEVSKAYSLGNELSGDTTGATHIVQNVDRAELHERFGNSLLEMAVLQLTPETVLSTEVPRTASGFQLLREWPAASSDVGKHHAYAAQWFAMAALTIGLYVWFQIVAPLRKRSI